MHEGGTEGNEAGSWAGVVTSLVSSGCEAGSPRDGWDEANTHHNVTPTGFQQNTWDLHEL